MTPGQQSFVRPLSRAGRRLADALPGLAAVAVFLLWANDAGGFFPTSWYAGGLLFAAMLLVVVFALPGSFARLGRATAVALVAFAAFVGWSYLSISWADVPGDAWDGANRAALYLVVFGLFALWQWSSTARLVVLGGFALGVALLGVGTLLAAGLTDDPGPYFASGRFLQPIGYSNGNAGVYLLAFWPALFLASRRETPMLLRPIFLAAAGAVLELAVLPESRGAALVFPLLLAAYFVIVPARVRSLVFVLPVAVTLAVSIQRLLDVSTGTTGPALAAGADQAVETVLWSALALLVAGAVLVAADRRLDVPERLRRKIERALAVGAVVAGVVALAVAVPTLDPIARAESAWAEFKGDAEPVPHSDVRLLRGFDTNRLDFWRVAVMQFREHPVGGIGSENYAVAYARERDSGEETLYPHSLVLEVPAQTGVVGSIFFLVFLGAALTAAVSARSRQQGIDRAAVSVCLVTFAYWFAHASIDWFWELPALTAPALAFLALAGSTPRPATAGASGRNDLVARVLAGALLVVVCASFAFPLLSARESQRAASLWSADYEAATASLARARRLNPLTDRADLVSGSIERRRGDWTRMAAAYERALARNPHSWYSRLQLALALAKLGRVDEAQAQVEEARRLNPTEPLVSLVGGWLERGEPVDVDEVADTLLARHAEVTGAERPPEPTREP